MPNRTELGQLAERPVDTPQAIATAARALIAAGVETVIVTLGADGALVVTPDGQEHVPGVAVAPVDTTGAGDAFIGGFAHFYALSGKVIEAADRAVRYAALSTTRRGAQASYADAAEFQAFCDHIRP